MTLKEWVVTQATTLEHGTSINVLPTPAILGPLPTHICSYQRQAQTGCGQVPPARGVEF